MKTSDDDFWIEPTFSDEEREAFRWRIEALLNGVLRVQRMAQLDIDRSIIRRNRIDLCQQAAKLVGDVCGDWLKVTEADAETPLAAAAFNLRVWSPLLAMQDDFFWEELIDEIERLPYGDEPQLLRPATRKRGGHPQPARMARSRLAALQWARFLKSRQLPPQQYKHDISLAFATDWETIRKWLSSAERIYGVEEVNAQLADASEGFGLWFVFPNYHEGLHYYGAVYRRLAGLREIDFETFSKALLGKENS